MTQPASNDSPGKSPLVTVPPVPAWFHDGFHRFLVPYLRRHFHAIAVDRSTRPESTLADSQPLLVYANHPSWWDPLTAHFMNRVVFPGRQLYAPIDAAALQNYKVFGKLGFYGVQMNTTSGASAFLKQSRAILDAPGTALWLTPEGRFTDCRDAEPALMPGLSHLCSRMTSGVTLPMALEYVFWDERLPVCLVKFGEPIAIANHTELDKPAWNELLTDRLRQTQANLQTLAIARSSEPFENLLAGTRGAGVAYDSFRRIKSLVTGQKFKAQHGEQFE